MLFPMSLGFNQPETLNNESSLIESQLISEEAPILLDDGLIGSAIPDNNFASFLENSLQLNQLNQEDKNKDKVEINEVLENYLNLFNPHPIHIQNQISNEVQNQAPNLQMATEKINLIPLENKVNANHKNAPLMELINPISERTPADLKQALFNQINIPTPNATSQSIPELEMPLNTTDVPIQKITPQELKFVQFIEQFSEIENIVPKTPEQKQLNIDNILNNILIYNGENENNLKELQIVSKNETAKQISLDPSKNLEEQTEFTQTMLISNPEETKKFLDTNTKEDNRKDEEHVESTFILGKNKETISHTTTSNTPDASPQIGGHSTIKKIIELTDQLKATNGGTAKFQIQDTNLGKINLQIDMKDKNSITIFIQTEHTDVKKNIEDKIDSLKQSLNSQKIELTDFKVTILDKPLSSQSQFNNSGQQDQNSQSFNQNAFFQHNFKQNTGHKGNDGNEHNNTMSLNDNKKYKNMQKNSITNIQRGANGSIHVSA